MTHLRRKDCACWCGCGLPMAAQAQQPAMPVIGYLGEAQATETATLARNGPPPMTRVTLRTCRVQYPGGSKRVHVSIASPFTRPSPLWRRVGIRITTFETCSDFTHVTARSIAQPPNAGFVSGLPP